MHLIVKWVPPGPITFGNLQETKIHFCPPVTNHRIRELLDGFYKNVPKGSRIASYSVRRGF
jgi:hypothetical protein